MKCPNDLELLIHCHVCPAPHPRLDSAAILEGIRRLTDSKLIHKTKEVSVYGTTPRGVAHIKQLLALPYPSIAWVDKDNNIIGE